MKTNHLEAATRLMIRIAIASLLTGILTGAMAVGTWLEGYWLLSLLLIPGLPALVAFTFTYPTLKDS